MKIGRAFEDEDVVRNYAYRAPYCDGVYAKLLEVSPRYDSLLDIGCGTGKIVRRLCHSFNRATAVDPSSAMLSVAKSLAEDTTSNVTWVEDTAESFPLVGIPYDLVVAAASIHWMDHAALFPRLHRAVSEEHVLAVVDGDGAFDPPWEGKWRDLVERWVRRLKEAGKYELRGDLPYQDFINQYRQFINISGETSILSDPVSQTIDDFVLCQHSRNTFAPSRLGPWLAEFDQELKEILAPYASDGKISYPVRTQIAWGTIRSE